MMHHEGTTPWIHDIGVEDILPHFVLPIIVSYHCIALHVIVPYRIALYCIVMHPIVLYT